MKAKALTFIFITVLIDCIGIRVIYPVASSIIMEAGHVTLKESTLYGGMLISVYVLMQFLFSPLLGKLSDMYGRRPILLLSLMGLGFDYLFQAYADTLLLLFIGR